MSKFLNRNTEGWNCARDNAFNRIVSDVQANKVKYQKVKSAAADLREELLNEDAYKQYENLTIRDQASGLYNGYYFKQKLTKELKRAKRYKRPFSLMLISMDRLAELQKLYGDLLVNQLLEQEARVISSSVREVDLVFRISPDLFAIIFPETYASKATIVGQRICDRTRGKAIDKTANTVGATISAGISSFPTHGRQDKELYIVAAQFLDQAQKAGGNKVLTS